MCVCVCVLCDCPPPSQEKRTTPMSESWKHDDITYSSDGIYQHSQRYPPRGSDDDAHEARALYLYSVVGRKKNEKNQYALLGNSAIDSHCPYDALQASYVQWVCKYIVLCLAVYNC